MLIRLLFSIFHINNQRILCRFLLSLFYTTIVFHFGRAQQAYCWDPCQFNCPQIGMGPRLCPPEDILTYYDCCPADGCCQYIKWPNLLFLVFIIFLLLAGCCCCAFFLLTDARQRMFHRQQREEAQRQIQQHKLSQAVYPVNGEEGGERRGRGGGGGDHPGFHHKKHATTIV